MVELTRGGNEIRIRHHEVDRIELPDELVDAVRCGSSSKRRPPLVVVAGDERWSGGRLRMPAWVASSCQDAPLTLPGASRRLCETLSDRLLAPLSMTIMLAIGVSRLTLVGAAGAGTLHVRWESASPTGGMAVVSLMRSLLIIALLAFGLAACGEGDSVSAEDANQIATELAQKTQSLSDDVAEAGRALVDDPNAVDKTRDRLRELADRARDQAGEAEDLPDSEAARDPLRDANDRIAEAADQLADADPGDQAVADGRNRLDDARNRIGDAADRLADELPPDARKDLDALRERLSSETP